MVSKEKIELLRQKIDEADAIVVGGGQEVWPRNTTGTICSTCSMTAAPRVANNGR